MDRRDLDTTRRMLLIIDPQVDFINGSLPVPGAVEAMDALAEYVSAHGDFYHLIVITTDSHPANHCSFTVNGGQWPVHCVAHSSGAVIWPPVLSSARLTGREVEVLTKGDNPDVEEYSVMCNSSSARRLAEIVADEHITDIDVCGLAGDVCVLSSLRDAMQRFPEVNFRVLESFSPSIDGGKELREYALSEKISLR